MWTLIILLLVLGLSLALGVYISHLVDGDIDGDTGRGFEYGNIPSLPGAVYLYALGYKLGTRRRGKRRNRVPKPQTERAKKLFRIED